MIGQIMQPERPGLGGNFALDRIAELMQRLEITEDLQQLWAGALMRREIAHFSHLFIIFQTT
jgi:hypothetical protein